MHSPRRRIPDGSLGTYEGFTQTAGPWLPYTATFNIISPLYYSDGTGGPAVPATTGTYLHIYDRYAGNPDPVTDPHPGASSGDIYVNGSTSFYSGFGVSLYDFHELEKDLYIAPGSTQTYGEYGFAFDVIVHFTDGVTLNEGPLVDMFATDTTTDPDNPGGFATFASDSQQDVATQAVYNAVMAAPEPSSLVLAALGAAALAICGWRRRMGGRIVSRRVLEPSGPISRAGRGCQTAVLDVWSPKWQRELPSAKLRNRTQIRVGAQLGPGCGPVQHEPCCLTQSDDPG